MSYELFCGDCLEILPTLTGQVDAIITDLPYGTTACHWDVVIPFAPMWVQVRRLLKPRGAFVTTASQPFTSKLIMSNLECFRQELIWDKIMTSTIATAKIQHLRSHENIVIFYDSQTTYNPQLGSASKPFGKLTATTSIITGSFSKNRGGGIGYPKSIIRLPRPNNLTDGGFHPTQKPIALYEYLVKTYTNPGDTVLDFTMGSGTTGVACIQTGRNFIGVEMDAEYFSIAQRRIQAAQPPLFVEQPPALVEDPEKQGGLF